MLAYVFSNLKQVNFKNIEKESFDNMHNLFATILIKGVSKQIKRGLYKSYENKVEDISVMRGKIDISRTLKNKINRKQLLACEYDELTENNILNQIIKTTVKILVSDVNVDNEIKDKLKKVVLFFENVDFIEPNTIKWNKLKFHRNNRNYEALLNICQLIIEGMLLTTEKGKYKLTTFINEENMCKLFEKFVLAYYKRHFPQISAKSERMIWAVDDETIDMLPIMQTDITLSLNKKILIIDTKYYTNIFQKNYGKNTIHSNNLYQIFAYVKNKMALLENSQYQVSGMILYAKTNEVSYFNSRYKMSGNYIWVRTLDLNCTFDKIEQQLDNIVINYFDKNLIKKIIK